MNSMNMFYLVFAHLKLTHSQDDMEFALIDCSKTCIIDLTSHEALGIHVGFVDFIIDQVCFTENLNYGIEQ